MADHKTLKTLPNKKSAWTGRLLIAGIILLVTFGKITQTYGEFWKEAFDVPGWVAALFTLNLVIGGAFIAGLIALVKPPNWIPYAAVVAISLTSFFATPIAIETFTGSDLPGKPESAKVSDLYSPLDKIVSAEIDKPVREKKSDEIEKVVAKYEKAGEAGKDALLDRVNARLAASSKTAEEKVKIEADVKKLLDDTSRKYRPRLRDVAQTLYAAELREIVQSLAK